MKWHLGKKSDSVRVVYVHNENGENIGFLDVDLADQIIREHNAHGAMVELITEFNKWFSGWCPNNQCCAYTGLPLLLAGEQILLDLAKSNKKGDA